jgi:methanogenic corrinoid protein MtbC1
MNALNNVAAELLETSAAGYAAAALVELLPADRAAPPGTEGATWKVHLTQRVLELAAAVRVAQPVLFAQRMQWLRRAARARGVGEQDLKRALLSLCTALRREVPGNLQPAIAPALALAVRAFDGALSPDPLALDAAKPVDRLALRYVALCLEGKPEEARALVLRELDGALTPAAAYTQVLLAAEREIGQLWHVGDLSIAEEHLVSESTRELMALIVAKHAPPRPLGPSLIAASVAGNAHDLGLRAVADLFRIAGWRCLYLGANVPAEDLGRAAETFDVELVVLNATLSTQLKPLGEAIETIRRLAPRRKILVGGLAFGGLPDLWQQLGADAHAPTIEGAVAVGAALVQRVQGRP